MRNHRFVSLIALAAVLLSMLAGSALSSRPFASLFPALFAGKAALASASAVVDGVSLDPSRGIGAGSWVTIYGSNLTATTRSWQAADFVDGRAPTSLAGVSVKIGGRASYISFVGQGADFGADYDQVNVLAPSDLPAGPAEVEVTTASGEKVTTTAAVNRLVPGFFAFEPQARKYIATTSPDGVEYIGEFGLFGSAWLDRPIRPARQGESITLYGAGCGALDPPVPSGTVASAASRVVENVAIHFGDKEAEVEYAGATPGLAGVCQFNVVVPPLEPGAWEVVARIGSAETQRGVHVLIEKAPYDAWDHLGVSEFRLTGAHVFTECTDCHIGGRFRGTPSTCTACHLLQYSMTTSPNHATQGYPANCVLCHSTSQFQGARGGANHANFALTGAHTELQCAQCHPDGLQKVDTACASCHLTDYQSTTAPNHVEADYPQDCSICHNTETFGGGAVNHSQTRLPLTGRHGELACEVCHTATADPPDPECANCHLAQYQATATPNHQAEGYPTSCETCHNATSFSGATLRHPVERFPLAGGHEGLECQACHASDSYAGLASACASCHLDNYNATSAPNHAAAGYPQDCELCHTPAAWLGADDAHTAYALTGAHRTAACAGCHGDGTFAGTPRNCDACHLPAFQAATNPDHAAAGFPQDCELCHGTSQFVGARFVHSSYALTGAHAPAGCGQCHSDGIYAGTPTDCASCHTAGTNPSHAGFPTTCESCHSTSAWQGATFNHTAWSLTGAHTSASCSQCHSSGAYAGTPTNCASCHTAGTNPSHAGFPTTCQSCHSTSAWQGATFSHSAWSLTGAHTSASCSQCHSSGTYAGTPTTCASCHTAGTNPSHAGFPTTCQSCHSTSGWLGATFSHTAWSLTGAHASASCSQCHSSGTYAGTPTNCSSCHTAGTNPSHAGFPSNCQSCHSTSAWLGATFNHSWFPLYSGKHKEKWSACSDCHTNPSNYSVFSCFGCHSQSKTTDDHDEVEGFVYDSVRCYQCHPKGKED